MPNAGWFADPTGRHRLRYRDGRWTASVADEEAVEEDRAGLRQIEEARFRNRLIGGVAAVVGIAVLVLVVAAISSYNQESSYQQDVHERIAQTYVRELDRWQLPPSVVRSSEPDSMFVNGPQNIVWMTRYFVARPGFTAVQAANDLVAALRAQGYHVSALSDSWTFNCKSDCLGTIEVAGRDTIRVSLAH